MTTADEFAELYVSSRKRLAGQLYALTGDEHGAYDLVEEAFVRTWTRWDRVARYDDPEAFVRRVAFNLAKSHWRRLRRIVFSPGPPERLDAGGTDPAQHRDLVTALTTLPMKEREALVLHYLVGEQVDEIARQMKVPPGTVKSWLSRGRRHLAERLAGEAEEMTQHG